MLPNERILKRALRLSVAGSRGGPVRLSILLVIKDKPSNTNELSAILKLDYKTVQHHIRVLERAGLIISQEKKYANSYTLSGLLSANTALLDELSRDLGHKKIYKF